MARDEHRQRAVGPSIKDAVRRVRSNGTPVGTGLPSTRRLELIKAGKPTRRDLADRVRPMAT
jgi:hypothetical protein